MEKIKRWRWRLLAIILLGGIAALIQKWRVIRENSQDPVILEAAARYGVDPALVKAVVWRESWFNPNARGRKGEVGLMQIREKTAEEWAAEEHVHLFTHFQMLDPVKNTRAGTWYLRKLLRRYPRTDNPLPYALADYNAGRARVLQWSNSGAAATNSAAFLARMDYPGTRRYVQSVMKRYQHYRPIFPPKSKRLASNIFLPLSEVNRRFSSNPNPRSSESYVKQVLRSFKHLAFPFILSAFPGIQRRRPKSNFVRANFDPTACPQAGASAEPPTEAKPAQAPDFPRRTSRAGRGLHTAPIPDPTAARFDVAEVARSGGLDACIPAQRRGKFDNSLWLNDPPNIDRPNINRNLESAMEVPRYQHLATKI